MRFSLPILVLVVGIAWAAGGPRSAIAGTILDEPILGGSLLVATTGDVTAKFLGSDAGYFNTLYLVGFDTPLFDKDSRPNNEITLPGTFNAAAELVFRLDVRDTGESFFSGDMLRNPDSLAHVEAITTFDQVTGAFVTTLGFEDLLGGGDEDYNDFMFQLTNVVDPPNISVAAAPAPSVLALLGLGLAAIGYQRRTHIKAA